MAFTFDLDSVLAFQSLAGSSSFATAIAIFCARWAIFLNIPLALYVAFSPRAVARHAFREAFWMTSFGFFIVAVVSKVVQRPRPFLASHLVSPLIPPPYNTSFPSGHTMASIAIASAFFIADRRIGWISFTLAFLTMMGRIAVGVHYPSDILGGIVVGGLSVVIIRLGHAGLRSHALKDAEKRHKTHS